MCTAFQPFFVPKLMSLVQRFLNYFNLHVVIAFGVGEQNTFMYGGACVQTVWVPCKLDIPLSVTALDGQPLGSGKGKQLILPIQLQVLDYHVELIQLHLVDSPELPLVLGHPWLSIHNPQIDWPSGRILGLSPSCHLTCQQLSPDPSGPALLEAPDAPVSLVGDGKPDLSRIPQDYWDLGQVFSK